MMKDSSPVSTGRYMVLVVPGLAWALFGYYLFARAYWPSTCQPSGLTRIYECSVRLPENPGWVQLALLTWLWATPLLLAMRVLSCFRADTSQRSEFRRSCR